MSEPNTPQKPSASGMDALSELMAKNRDPKEQLYLEMGQTLFKEDKLYMISRLNGGRMEYIIKNIILIDFYQTYFAGCRVDFKLKKIDNPPYYNKSVIVTRPDPDRVLIKVYNRFVNKILKLTISDGGEGRKEIIKILGGIEEQLREKIKSLNIMGGS